VALIAGAAVAVALAACGGQGPVLQGAPTTELGAGGGGPTTRGNETTTTLAGTDARHPWDKAIVNAVNDVQRFWKDEFPKVYGTPWQPLHGGLFAYSSTSDPPPCGNPPPVYKEIAGNAFYCPSADLVAWDTERLIPDLYEQFGAFSLGLVIAHELGHAVQTRAGVPADSPSILLEQQADCFAGAWTAWAETNSKVFAIKATDLDKAVAGFLELGDAPGSVSSDPQAHGSAFDRIGAYEDGFQNTASKCATYPQAEPPTFQLPFSSQQEYETGGNLPYDEVETDTVNDLEYYWGQVLPAVFGVAWSPVGDVKPYDPASGLTCGSTSLKPKQLQDTAFYCVPDDYVAWDEADLMPSLYDHVGDFAMAIIIANQYSLAAQVRLGNTQNTVESNLQADCFTGTWTASLIPGFRTQLGLEENIDISPGDLDEAVSAFLGFGDTDAGQSTEGTAFQKVAAFRDGFLNGINQCKTYLSGGAPGG
jgi:predicted metalloprotease